MSENAEIKEAEVVDEGTKDLIPTTEGSIGETKAEEPIKEEKHKNLTIVLSSIQKSKLAKIVQERTKLNEQAQIVQDAVNRVALHEGDFIDLILEYQGINPIDIASIKLLDGKLNVVLK